MSSFDISGSGSDYRRSHQKMGGFDQLFMDFHGSTPNPTQWDWHQQSGVWPYTWKCINTKILAHQIRDNNQQRVWEIIQQIKVILQENRRLRVARVVSTVKLLLDSYLPLIIEAWVRMRGWYNPP